MLARAVLLAAALAAADGIVNFPQFIENAVRDYRRQKQGTDESYFKQKPILQEYDFVVIGSGPGGAVVANRLTEVPKWKVLLLEAGKEETILVDIPVFVGYLQFTDYNWGFQAEPQPGQCQGIEDGRCRWPRGKSLGGTTSINYMIYTRGNREDYNMWAENGNTGWSYDEVLPYFLKSEDIRIKDLQNSPHHSRFGPLHVENIPFRTPLGAAFLEAGKELGYPVIDYNNGTPPEGFAFAQENMVRGQRMSAAKAFLRPVKSRENLHISTKSRVTKILIDPDTKTAYGVEFVKNRKTYIVKARKEVILSGGAMNSPQLLMLSGVGPREHLEEFDIPVIHDLAGVGQNLQEHVSYCGLTFLVNQTYVGLLESRLTKPHYIVQLLNHGTGPLSLPGGVEGLAYLNTKHNDDKRGRPDIEFIFASGSLTTDNGGAIRKGIGVTDEVYKKTYRPVEDRDSWTIWPMLLHPKSRGYIRLKSKNPWKWPLFYANYFQHEQDLETVVEGVKMAVKLSRTRAFQKYGSYLNTIPLEGCQHHVQNSDDYWRCAVRSLTTTLHHQSGTCKMGPASDPEAVVSPELLVYGINNLRVVDASIIPQLPTAHTTAPTYMIGEKASDMIKAAWGEKGAPQPQPQPQPQPAHQAPEDLTWDQPPSVDRPVLPYDYDYAYRY